MIMKYKGVSDKTFLNNYTLYGIQRHPNLYLLDSRSCIIYAGYDRGKCLKTTPSVSMQPAHCTIKSHICDKEMMC